MSSIERPKLLADRPQKPRFLVLDTLDDRREIYRLLARLSPARRLRWLNWCCERAVMPNTVVHPRPSRRCLDLAKLAMRDSSADARLTLDLYFDFWALCTQYELDADAGLVELVRMVRETHV